MDRFWSKVNKADGCWTWTAYRDDKGYGAFGLDGKVKKAHRVAYAIANGPIPDGAHVLHSCDNPPCVNPSHLRIGTHADNMQDRLARGHDPNARKTECLNGHPFDEENTYPSPEGRRGCRTCRTAARRAYLDRIAQKRAS